MQRSKGVTLIELIVVLAIVAILAVIAYPSYQTYLIESRRSDAINALRENQLRVEGYMQQQGVTPQSTDITLLTTSPEGFYTIAYTRVDDQNYQLVATAAANTTQTKDTQCTTITLVNQMDQVYPTFCH